MGSLQSRWLHRVELLNSAASPLLWLSRFFVGFFLVFFFSFRSINIINAASPLLRSV